MYKRHESRLNYRESAVISMCIMYYMICAAYFMKHLNTTAQALEFRTPLFPHLVPPAIMVWIFVWKYIFEPFIHILQHFVLQLSRSTNFCFWVQLPFYLNKQR